MRAKINNSLYLLHKWFDKSKFSVFIIVIMILIPNILIATSKSLTQLVLGIPMWLLVLMFCLSRILWSIGKIKFDKSVFPNLSGETIIIRKDFFFNDIHKTIHNIYPKPSGSLNYIGGSPILELRKGEDFKISWLVETEDDIFFTIIDPIDNSEICDISYTESRKYWTTKGNLRNSKLEKLGL